MERNIYLVILLLIVSCNQNPEIENNSKPRIALNSQEDNKQDSIYVVKTLIDIYKSHLPQDSNFQIHSLGNKMLGLKFDVLSKSIRKLIETQQFSQGFIRNLSRVGFVVDSIIKKDKTLVYGMINFAFEDYNIWYGGNMGEPDWKYFKVVNFNREGNLISFDWSVRDFGDLNRFSVQFLKELGKWKLHYLQGFDINNYLRKE